MAFKAIVCQLCGDTEQPHWVHRTTMGRIEEYGLTLHADCCGDIHDELLKLGGGSNVFIERFRIHRPNWPIAKKELA